MSTAPIARPLDPDWLERELLMRGWNLHDLADAARLSHGTATAARAGKRLDTGSLRKIAAALNANPPDPAFAKIAEGLR